MTKHEIKGTQRIFTVNSGAYMVNPRYEEYWGILPEQPLSMRAKEYYMEVLIQKSFYRTDIMNEGIVHPEVNIRLAFANSSENMHYMIRSNHIKQ